ncbi:antibiotic biosynthesis monooxygenase [Emcibacter sp. SYSU 3D8]|uniref:antibiotic biosynthesis monooxygenase family protein n=1 Tax=Emcibacter sp. SYSU 3D8 TaxID=3133969 RepID=UPI0031FF392D
MEKGAYAVIFTSRLGADAEGYGAVADRMETLVRGQPGYLGHDSVRGEGGLGITVSYWASEAAVAAWRANAEHLGAQAMGRARFYDWFRLDVCRVERTHGFARD